MSGSLFDMLTTVKNLVTATSTLSTNATALVGAKNAPGITAQTVVSANPGRLYNISVIVAGGATGSVWDANTTASATSARLIATIPTAVGVYTINLPVAYGIVVTPGTSQTIAVGYS
jgi:hypothetical protein